MSSLSKFLGNFIYKQRWIFLAIFLCTLAWSLEATLWPYLLGKIVDTFTRFDCDRGSAWEALQGLLLGSIALWGLVEVAFRTRGFLLARAVPKLEASVRMEMFDHV